MKKGTTVTLNHPALKCAFIGTVIAEKHGLVYVANASKRSPFHETCAWKPEHLKVVV